jgi:hypothetical protein
VTVFTTTGGEHFMPGLLNGAVTLRGYLDTDAGVYSEAIAASGVDDGVLTTILPAGLTLGYSALIAVQDLSSFEIPAQVTDPVQMTVTGQPNDGVDMGVCLHVLSAETADGDGASVDNAASSAGGVVASLHVTAFSGFSGAVIKVQHSTDDAVWADLVTFTTVAATTSERIKVTGTVNQYLRATWDVTGTGSVTFAVAGARR